MLFSTQAISQITFSESTKVSCFHFAKLFVLHQWACLAGFLFSYLGVKPFECGTCGKAFSSHSNRKNHINAVHKSNLAFVGITVLCISFIFWPLYFFSCLLGDMTPRFVDYLAVLSSLCLVDFGFITLIL